MAYDFRLVLRQHAPMIVPIVPPRLDTLLVEATARRHDDWKPDWPLPLVWGQEVGGYRASQFLFGATAEHPLVRRSVKRPSRSEGLERAAVIKPRKSIVEIGGGARRRFTGYEGHLAPFVVFYGQAESEDQAQEIPALLELLDGMGIMTQAGYGAVTVDAMTEDATAGWRYRSWPARAGGRCSARRTVRAFESLHRGGADVHVIRPQRINREAIR